MQFLNGIGTATSLGTCFGSSCITENACFDGSTDTNCLKVSLSNGEYCSGAAKYRSTDVYFQCGTTIEQISVTETSTCTYKILYSVICQSYGNIIITNIIITIIITGTCSPYSCSNSGRSLISFISSSN